MRTAQPEPSGFAAKAKDLQALRDAVDNAATVSGALWLSYLFVFFYLAIAAGAVTHKDLFFENPVKLPFLNVELPLTAFFVLGPLLFLIVHWYTLLHFAMLAGKVGAFHTELEDQISDDETRARLRRQLPTNIFVQFLAGPRDLRDGLLGWMLRGIAWISLIVGPVLLLVFFQLQFLPYHDPTVSWWQRFAVVIDLLLLWTLWPVIGRATKDWLRRADFLRPGILALLLLSVVPAWLVFAVATFPGEWLHKLIPSVESEWTPHKLLVAGEVDFNSQRPSTIWSNRLVVPGIDVREQAKFDTEEKIKSRPTTLLLRKRRLENAILEDAYLPKADFTGAELPGAFMRSAQLQGARLYQAQLHGANLVGALGGARLTDVFVWRANPSRRVATAAADAGAYVENLENKPWSAENYAELRRRITETVPAGRRRYEALAGIASLDPGKEITWDFALWTKLEKNRPTPDAYRTSLVGVLQTIGCEESGAPYVVKNLSKQIEYRFEGDTVLAKKLADAFLGANCAGARGLPEEDKQRLRKIGGRTPSESPAPVAGAAK
jgi:hypothetical protein